MAQPTRPPTRVRSRARRKRWMISCLAVLTACSSGGTVGIDDSATATASGAPDRVAFDDASPTEPDVLAVTTDRPIVLDITAWKGNESEPAALPELIEKFEAEHPDIDVELTYVSRLDNSVLLRDSLEGSTTPDVVMMDIALADDLVEAGLLADLGVDSPWAGRVDPNLRKTLVTPDEQIHIMPVEIIGIGNFVNLDLLAEVGITEPPTTIEELKSACTVLDAAGVKPLVFTGSLSAAFFVMANGLESSTDSAADLGSGAATFTESESFNDALEATRELIGYHCFNPIEQASLDPWSTALTAFAEGEVAMMPQGAWNIGAFTQVDGLNFAFTPIPSGTGDGVALDFLGFGWSIPAGADDAAAAQTFVDWFALPEHIQLVLEAEAAYTPFDDGSSGTPSLAQPFDLARNGGAAIALPFATLDWSPELEAEMWDGMTAFLLDPTMSNAEVLGRWDRVVEGR